MGLCLVWCLCKCRPAHLHLPQKTAYVSVTLSKHKHMSALKVFIYVALCIISQRCFIFVTVLFLRVYLCFFHHLTYFDRSIKHSIFPQAAHNEMLNIDALRFTKKTTSSRFRRKPQNCEETTVYSCVIYHEQQWIGTFFLLLL